MVRYTLGGLTLYSKEIVLAVHGMGSIYYYRYGRADTSLAQHSSIIRRRKTSGRSSHAGDPRLVHQNAGFFFYK